MIKPLKDKIYDQFLKEPTQENCEEMDEVDFKEQWIEKGHLAKIMLSMGNSRGGIIVIGVREEKDGSLTPVGVTSFKDKATINNEISKYIPPDLDYVIYDYDFESSEYPAVQGKKFQLLLVNDTPSRLPFISMWSTTDLEKDTIYIRRGTKCEKANSSEIENLIESKIETIFKESSNLSLNEHLLQLKTLYEELPQKIKVLVKKGELSAYGKIQVYFESLKYSTPDEYIEIDNPNYPKESYEAFISRMIQQKKLKIEKILDLK